MESGVYSERCCSQGWVPCLERCVLDDDESYNQLSPLVAAAVADAAEEKSSAETAELD